MVAGKAPKQHIVEMKVLQIPGIKVMTLERVS